MLDRRSEQKSLDHIGSLKANELVAPMFNRKTQTAKAYDSKTHLDRVKHSCLRRRKDLINSNRSWSSSIGCRKSGSRITTDIDLTTVSKFNKVLWFSHLSTGYLARFSKPECCIGSSAAQDLITRSMYLRPCISQESFDCQHAHVLGRYMVLITRVDPISHCTVVTTAKKSE